MAETSPISVIVPLWAVDKVRDIFTGCAQDIHMFWETLLRPYHQGTVFNTRPSDSFMELLGMEEEEEDPMTLDVGVECSEEVEEVTSEIIVSQNIVGNKRASPPGAKTPSPKRFASGKNDKEKRTSRKLALLTKLKSLLDDPTIDVPRCNSTPNSVGRQR